MRTRKRGGPAAAAICALGWLAAGPAAAGPEPPAPGAVSEAPEIQDARDAYRLGVSLIKQGQWNDALAAFERSFRLKPDAVTAFNIGYCERALGRLTRARASFRRALAAPELPPDKAAEARGYVAEVESRLSRVVLTLSPAGASVAVDGRPLEVSHDGGDPRAPAAELVAGTREPGPP
jgi:tetratricopeptide (TPR) repeat protein